MNERLRGIAERIDTNVEELLDFLDSPTGRRLRKRLAAGLIISVPLVMRIPGLRRTSIGRLVEVAGGTALVVKVAELVRDWERSHDERPALIDAVQAEPPLP
jgi:competence protein ComGC